eukprot:1115264-Pelagomonas_calceolata.AAC.2
MQQQQEQEQEQQQLFYGNGRKARAARTILVVLWEWEEGKGCKQHAGWHKSAGHWHAQVHRHKTERVEQGDHAP